jgi:putative nucleotidyltransferase with HDIG domain
LKNNLLKNSPKALTGIVFATSPGIKFLIGIVTFFFLFWMLPEYENIESKYEVGTVWSAEDLIAPFSFPIYKDELEYEQEKQDVMKNLTPVFDRIEQGKNPEDSIDAFRESVLTVLSAASELEKSNNGFVNSESLDSLKSIVSVKFTYPEWETLYALFKGSQSGSNVIDEFFRKLQTSIDDLSQQNIIDLSKETLVSKRISVKETGNKLQQVVETDNVLDSRQALNKLVGAASPFGTDTSMNSIYLKSLQSMLKPNLIYNSELSDLEKQNRIDQIPKTIGIVRENERIISKHDPVNRLTKMKLDSYKRVRLEKIGVQDILLQQVGKILTVFVLLLVLGVFLYYIRPTVYNDNLQLLILASLILVEGFFAYTSLKLNVPAPVELLIFVPVASILLTIIFDSRLAFYSVTVICFLIAVIRGGDFSIAFISFCGSVLAIFSERDIKNRSQIFRSFFFILIGYTLSILAINLVKIEDPQKILTKLLFGGINAVMSPVIAFGLLIFYEKVFKVTTDLTLLELSDFNHPLLKELSSKAPGTFHHSIIMGNLSEAAAESIGANSILARVGCYYHDIGKMSKPQFFIENQLDQNNKHNELNPTMSTKIIISHVRDGIEMAKKHKLPQQIIDFIPMHHGTTLVAYFYDKAQSSSKEEISDQTYRYPGPKPQTKETGIVMLADAIEASTRTIEEPSPQKLENNIREVIRRRFMEGELDECDLTLKDLTKIKDSFLKILVGIHHHRLKYPDMNQLELHAEKKASKPTGDV